MNNINDILFCSATLFCAIEALYLLDLTLDYFFDFSLFDDFDGEYDFDYDVYLDQNLLDKYANMAIDVAVLDGLIFEERLELYNIFKRSRLKLPTDYNHLSQNLIINELCEKINPFPRYCEFTEEQLFELFYDKDYGVYTPEYYEFKTTGEFYNYTARRHLFITKIPEANRTLDQKIGLQWIDHMRYLRSEFSPKFHTVFNRIRKLHPIDLTKEFEISLIK